MKRHLMLALVVAAGVLAIPLDASANGEFCGAPTTIFGTDGPDSPATGFDGTSGDDVMFAFRGDDIVFGRTFSQTSKCCRPATESERL